MSRSAGVKMELLPTGKLKSRCWVVRLLAHDRAHKRAVGVRGPAAAALPDRERPVFLYERAHHVVGRAQVVDRPVGAQWISTGVPTGTRG